MSPESIMFVLGTIIVSVTLGVFRRTTFKVLLKLSQIIGAHLILILATWVFVVTATLVNVGAESADQIARQLGEYAGISFGILLTPLFFLWFMLLMNTLFEAIVMGIVYAVEWIIGARTGEKKKKIPPTDKDYSHLEEETAPLETQMDQLYRAVDRIGR